MLPQLSLHWSHFAGLPTRTVLTLVSCVQLGPWAQAEDPAGEKQLQYTEYALEHPGDAERGEELYQDKTRTACASCHAIHGIEKSGPNLDGIADKYSRRDLIHHILNPNAFIQPGYETATALTKAGEIITGRIRLSTRLEVRLLLASGKLRSVKRKQLASFKSSPQSLMPQDLIDAISVQEFTDLLAYLETLHAAELSALTGPGEELAINKLTVAVGCTPLHPPDLKFDNPVWVTEIPGQSGQLVVLEHQRGLALRLDTNTSPPTKHLFLDLADEIIFSPNQGLMCLAFHPNYANNGKYYVKYEIQQTDGTILTTVNERLASEDRRFDSGQPSRRLLSLFQPAFNHNGGCLAFGPDGMLYVAFGDGGPQKDPPGYSQNPAILHGSMLRIDVNQKEPGSAYAIPEDNPFLNVQNGQRDFRPEIWAYGFREPWRFSFDAKTGDLWLGDVGQVKYEEVCVVRAGENHGWNVYEGYQGFSEQYRRPRERYNAPVLAYPRSLGVSVTGGYVYRGNRESLWYGDYIFGDYESRKVWALRMQDQQVKQLVEIGTAPEHIASFGTDAAGSIFVVGYEGTVFRLELDD